MIMDRWSLFLLILEIGLWHIATTSSRTHHLGSPVILQKRSISKDDCIPLEVATNLELQHFDRVFVELASGLNNIANSTGDIILFLGNTGVGKSSLVHLLAGEWDNFVAREDGEGTSNFYIEDISGKYVHNTTIDSTTTYPEAIVEPETGAILYDTPGFRDTRSNIHEIVAAYGLHKVAKVSQRIKIALLVSANSLTTMGSRDDFTNTLESFFKMFKNTQKFQDSTYLIATKTENRFTNIKKGPMLVSVETHIETVVKFIKKVYDMLENRKGRYYGDKTFIRNAQALIGSLEKKVGVFMKPDEIGPVSSSIPLMQSLQLIREMLLADDGYVTVDNGDLGYTVSDKAKVFIRNLYDQMNNQLEEVITNFNGNFVKFIIGQSEGVDNIEEIQSNLQLMDQKVGILIQKTNTSSRPDQYIDGIIDLTSSVDTKFCSLNVLDEIKRLSEYFDGLKELIDQDYYTPGKWLDSFHSLHSLVQNEIMYYNMLEDVYNKITDYPVKFSDPTIHAIRSNSGFGWKNVEELKKFLKHFGLGHYGNLPITPEKLIEMGSFMKSVVGQQSITCFTSDTLVVVDTILQTSILDSTLMSRCSPTKTVVLVATRKLYIDASIGAGLTNGKNLIVIAPEWHTLGRYTLSVDGESVKYQSQGKAATGKEGKQGKAGQSAGHFIGVALKHFGSELLTISACGGNGSPGQDGGDGRDGRDGRDGTQRNEIDSSISIKPILVVKEFKKTYEIKAEDYGSSGGDAGPGGYGGPGGAAGSVQMYTLSSSSSDRSTHRVKSGSSGRNGNSGTPGKGGMRGRDIIEEEREDRFLIFFPLGRSKDSKYVQGETRNPDGEIKPRSQSQSSETIARPQSTPMVCEVYRAVKHNFDAYDDIVSHSSNVEFREAFHRKIGC